MTKFDTKIVFIEAPYSWKDRPTIKPVNYGLERIAGYLVENGIKKENISYIDFTFLDDFDISLIPEASIYGFSVMQPNYENSLEIAKSLKKKFPECKIVFGGTAITDLKIEVLLHDFVDFAIFGMNEDSFFELIDSIFKKRQDFDSIPNLIFRDEKEKIIFNKIEFPPKNWEEIMPLPLQNIISGKYMENHRIVLGALGCGFNCNFCSLIRAQPRLVERDDKFIIEEISKFVHKDRKEKISAQVMHQNFCTRIKKFMKNLEEANLISGIKAISSNSRADTFLRYSDDFEYVLKKYPEMIFVIYVGTENYDEEELKRMNKGYGADIVKKASKKLIELEKRYDNFDFILSFIGYNGKTKKKNLMNNLKALKELFVDNNVIKPIYWLFSSPMRKNSSTEGRKKGHYHEDIFEMPEDEETKKIIQEYKGIVSQLPSFDMRKDLFLNLIISGKEADPNLVWAEINIMDALLKGKEELASKFAENCLNITKYSHLQ